LILQSQCAIHGEVWHGEAAKSEEASKLEE
jgi:hypothetical protein